MIRGFAAGQLDTTLLLGTLGLSKSRLGRRVRGDRAHGIVGQTPVATCDAALPFGARTSLESLGLIKGCRALGQLWVHVEPGVTLPSHVVSFLGENRHVKTVFEEGNRESRSPGIGANVGRFLSAATPGAAADAALEHRGGSSPTLAKSAADEYLRNVSRA